MISDASEVKSKILAMDDINAVLKLERQMLILESLDGTKIWSTGGIFDWIFMLWEIDDRETIEIIGTDTAMYLEFLEQSAKFFGVLSVFSIFLIPTYFNGDPKPRYDFRSWDNHQYAMQVLSFLNVTDNRPKKLITYIYTVVIIPFMIFRFIIYMLYKYHTEESGDTASGDLIRLRKGSVMYDVQTLHDNPALLEDMDMDTKTYTEIDVAKHTVFLKNFQKHIPRE